MPNLVRAINPDYHNILCLYPFLPTCISVFPRFLLIRSHCVQLNYLLFFFDAALLFGASFAFAVFLAGDSVALWLADSSKASLAAKAS